MGYLRAAETDLLELPSNSEYWVRMKKKAEYGDSRAAQTAMLQVSTTPNGSANGNVATDIEVGAYIGTLTVRMIVEWNLTDENEQPLPITVPNLDRLDDIDGEFLAAEAQKRKGERPAERQLPFQKPSGQSSTGDKFRTPKRTT